MSVGVPHVRRTKHSVELKTDSLLFLSSGNPYARRNSNARRSTDTSDHSRAVAQNFVLRSHDVSATAYRGRARRASLSSLASSLNRGVEEVSCTGPSLLYGSGRGRR